MEINGIIRLNLTAAEIEAALIKARELPTREEIDTALSEKQDILDFATEDDIAQAFDR